MKRLLFTLLICGLTFSAFSQSNTKNEKIRALLEITGSAKLGKQVMSTMIASFKNSLVNVNLEFWNEFEKSVKTEELVELIIPLYEKYYTEKDIDQLIAFYNTPVGKKMIATMPQIMQESMAIGQNWGRQLAEKLAKELKEKGLIKQ
ncbi:MAG: DUF2059 domain-containing protein [Bacteroidetes bacterium]|nr:DUF2059 domain-containing protein [Bacteroidota bacterium]